MGIAGETEEISTKVSNLNNAKESLVNIVSDLSALSEENAVSSEETNASMEELRDTFLPNFGGRVFFAKGP